MQSMPTAKDPITQGSSSRVGSRLVVGLLALCAASGCTKPAVELRPNLKPGETTRFLVADHTTGVIRYDDPAFPEITVESRGEIWLELSVEAVDTNGVASLTVKYADLSLGQTTRSNGATAVPYQLENGQTPLQQMCALLKGKSFAADIAPNGEVVALRGVGELVGYLKENVAFGNLANGHELTEDRRKELIAEFAGGFDEEQSRALLCMLLNVYPDEPVSVRDTWIKEPPPVGGLAEMRSITLTGRTEREATLGFRSSYAETDPRHTLHSAEEEGTATVDLATGLIQSMKLASDTDESYAGGSRVLRQREIRVDTY